MTCPRPRARCTTRAFFVYRTAADLTQNTIERFVLDDDGRGAAADSVVLDGIPASRNHDGGRLRIGPDGNLWATTGDAQEPERSRDDDSLGGKVLRMTTAGEPVDGSLVAVKGVRNGQGLAFLDGFDDDTPESGRIVVTDHGPSGELARIGHDEIDVVAVGEDLGWPEAHACDAVEGVRAPLLVFGAALPPGGVAISEGKAFVTALGAQKLVEVDLETGDAVVHLDGTFGRLRDIVVGPDGALWVTTSNCDGRGDCPDDGDKILRLSR